DGLLARLPRCLGRHPLAAVGSALDSDGKVVGIDPDWVGPLRGLPGIGNIIIEADGAAGRPFKAPRSHEPVIPDQCDLVVPIVGIDAVGKVLGEEWVHRAERVAALASIDLGQPVTAEVVATVMLHPQGNIKGAPPGARVVPLINKVDDDNLLDRARELARRLLERGAGRVVLAHTAFEPRVVEVLE
ncbi:MAG: selenium cofactor biosynthesis protein YqeC, partial [Dehalococcoidia bacterium]